MIYRWIRPRTGLRGSVSRIKGSGPRFQYSGLRTNKERTAGLGAPSEEWSSGLRSLRVLIADLRSREMRSTTATKTRRASAEPTKVLETERLSAFAPRRFRR